jgi:multicopper oxidase
VNLPSALSPAMPWSLRPQTRRDLLRTGLAITAAGALTACTREPTSSPVGFVTPNGPEVQNAELRRKPGAVREFQLTARPETIDLGGRTVNTWTYGQLPGAPIRVTAGEVIRATLQNQLPEPTTVHWHGLALRNDADGVPDVTQPSVQTGGQRTYEFTAQYPGTYWFHPHHGPQLDRGLYAPLIVEDPQEPLNYDDEWVVVLDDWLDGVTGTPDEVLAELKRGMSGSPTPGSSDMPGMDMGGHDMSSGTSMGEHLLMGASSDLLGGDAGDVKYPHFLINGRLPTAPVTFQGKPGTRLRLRIINAGGDTAFRLALAGHRMTVTHTDGFPVQPVEVDALLIGMGERYDVLVTLADGLFPLVALAEGKNATALALIRTGTGSAPKPDVRARELDGRVATYADLTPADSVRLADRKPDRTIRFELTGGMHRYNWAINGKAFRPDLIEPIRSGERVQVAYVNTTEMWHPMHLHGHTFALTGTGVRKDTAIVLPKQTLSTVFDADNPGIWMLHCHNIYHAEAGMMTLLGYQT